MADKDNEMMFETDDVAVIDTTGDQSIEATDINQVIAFIESRFKRAEDARTKIMKNFAREGVIIR